MRRVDVADPRLRQRLFRLIVTLKALTWAVIAVVLLVGLWQAATGALAAPPKGPLIALGVLVALQLVAMAAWWLVGRRP